MVCVSWSAWTISQSAAFVGLVATIAMLPAIFLGPLFGVLIDRINIKYAYYGTNSGMLVTAIILLLLTHFEALTHFRLMCLAAFMGVVASAHNPTRLSLGPRLVPRDTVSSVVTLSALNFNIARVIGPALTGFVIDAYGTVTALCCVIVLYLPNMGVIWRLEPRVRETVKEHPAFFASLLGGVKYLAERPILLWTLLLSGLYNGTTRGTTELFSVIADGTFSRGAIGLGQLGSAVGIGALTAALTKGLFNLPILQRLSLPVLVVASVAAFGTMVLGGTENWGVALASASIMGFCATFLGITVQTAIQADLPDNMRARVMSLWVVVAFGSPAIGAFLIGQMAGVWGMGLATKVSGFVALIGYLIIWRKALSLRANAASPETM